MYNKITGLYLFYLFFFLVAVLDRHCSSFFFFIIILFSNRFLPPLVSGSCPWLPLKTIFSGNPIFQNNSVPLMSVLAVMDSVIVTVSQICHSEVTVIVLIMFITSSIIILQSLHIKFLMYGW